MIDDDLTERRVPYVLAGIFLVLAIGIITVGYVSFNNYHQRFRKESESQIAAIVELKVGELDRWRKDRLEHGIIISRVESLSSLVRLAFIDGADPNARRQLHGWLVNYSKSFHYDQIRLLDIDGTTLVSMPEGRPPVSKVIRRRIAEVVQSKQVTLVDFYRHDHDARVYLTMLIPIVSDRDANRVIAVIAMRIDPEKYLYNLIKQWPIFSSSAETLLVRRDGDTVLFLNELKFQKNTALNLRSSLRNTSQPAVMAALDKEGIVEGVDYRGVPVVAYLKAVPDSPWHMVARIDKDDIYAPLKKRLWLIIAGVSLLLIIAGVTMALVWRQQRLVTYRRQAAIEREKWRLHDIIKRSLNEIYLFDRDTLHFTFVNDGGMANLGYSLEELQGFAAFDIKPEFSEESFRAAIAPLLAGSQERLIFETLHRRKDGTTYHVEAYLQLIATGDAAVFLAVVNDISARKLAEKELQDKNTELERFTYTVSHDLKSPLITIKGFTGALEKDLLNGNYQRMAGDLKRVSAAADKMNDLLCDLLELSTIGRVINVLEPVNMNRLADEVLAQLAGPLENKGLRVAVQPALPDVLCDRRRMTEVVQNLIENAINYMGNQPEPQILFGMREENGRKIFFVQDNGIGIDKKYHQIIFGLFNKLDAKSSGTGIGLALVKRIVEAHGGLVWVESAGAAMGSRFCFTMPAKSGNAQR
jgi:PAS domain S-box-containing protein